MLANRRTIGVEFGDCDPSGIVFNPNYFKWFDASVHALLRRAGLSLAQLRDDHGIDGIPLVENHARFLAPSRHGDDLVIETAIVGLHRCAIDLRHTVTMEGSRAVEATETRVWTVLDAESGRLRAEPLPAVVIERLSGSVG